MANMVSLKVARGYIFVEEEEEKRIAGGIKERVRSQMISLKNLLDNQLTFQEKNGSSK
jgi:hypothetical protein